MPDVDWKKIKAEYIRGVSYRLLSEKYGVSPSTMQKRGMNEKWGDLRKKARKKTDEKIVESVSGQEAKRVERFKRISDKLLTKIEEGIDSGDLIQTSRAMHDLTDSLKTLREINDIKSDIDIREQEARIEKLRKDASKDVDTDSGNFGVFILPPIEERKEDE